MYAVFGGIACTAPEPFQFVSPCCVRSDTAKPRNTLQGDRVPVHLVQFTPPDRFRLAPVHVHGGRDALKLGAAGWTAVGWQPGVDQSKDALPYGLRSEGETVGEMEPNL